MLRSIALLLVYIAIAAAIVAIVIAAFLWHGQERIVFQPPGPPHPEARGVRRIDMQAEDGQPLFAYLIGEPASAGCLSFLREFAGSARIVAGIPQLLDDLGLIDHEAATAVETSPLAEAALIDIGVTAGRIGRELVAGRSTVDELVAVTGLPVATVLGALTLLEGRGLVHDAYGRYRPTGQLAIVEPG